jgi:L-rhamnose isomerase
MKVSKDVKKMRYYESTLLNAYKVGNLYFNNIRSFDAELDFGSLLAYCSFLQNLSCILLLDVLL